MVYIGGEFSKEVDKMIGKQGYKAFFGFDVGELERDIAIWMDPLVKSCQLTGHELVFTTGNLCSKGRGVYQTFTYKIVKKTGNE